MSTSWVEEILGFVATGGGGTVGDDLYGLKMPATPADKSVAAIVPYFGGTGFRTFQPAAVHDIFRFQTIVRSRNMEPGDDIAAWNRLWLIFRLLDKVVSTDIGGTQYLQIEGVNSPFGLSRDPNEAWEGAANFEAWRMV